MSGALPDGEVVFCFTDVEGSTRLAHELGTRFAELNDEHRRAVRAVVARHDGVEVSTHGDAFFVAFRHAEDGAAAAAAIHDGLAELPLRVRIGLHVGTATVADGTYLGTEVNRAARIGDAAHGGQTLASLAIRERLDGTTIVIDLGRHRLKGFVEPVGLFQLGDGTFPPPRTIQHRALPVAADSFVGRDVDLERLLELTASGRLVPVVGTGGAGKTRLLVEAAARWERDAAGGVHWIPLADVDRPELVPAEIARALGVESLDQLPSRLGDARTVLLLDNAEHVAAAARDAVGEILRLCPSVTVVATSRERLRAPGEQLLPLRPLERTAARRLLVDRARQLNPTFTADDDAVDELCSLLDDLPLALEVAAARTTIFDLRRLSERLRQRRDLLGPLQAAIEWSYGLLGPEERALHARFSIFAAGCTLDAAEAIVGAGPDEWQSLVEKSLLEVEHHHAEPRLAMLETLRAYAADRLAEEGGDDELTTRYVDHYLRLAEEKDEVVRYGDTQLSALQWYAEELPNLRHAFELAVARGDAARSGRLALACTWTLWLWDHHEAYDWRTRALALPIDDVTLRVRLLAYAAQAAPVVGRPEAVAAYLEEAAELADASGDPFLQASVLETRAFNVPYAEARPLLEQVLVTMRELGRREEAVRAAINLGAIALAAFAWEDAAAFSETALELVRATGNRDGIATTSLNLAEALLQLGDDARAGALAAEVRAIEDEIGERSMLPVCDFVDAVIAARAGDHAAAAAAYASGEALLEELGWTLEDAEEELRRQARAAAGA